MLDHHIQRTIVYKLAFLPRARFSEIKPDDIENKLFTYHLKKVISAGFVEKSNDGLYSLTAEGQRLGYRAIKNEQFMLDKAYSILFLITRNSTGDWLLYRRKVQPLLGSIAFPRVTPEAGRLAQNIAHDEMRLRTGLDATYTPLGSGYFHYYHNNELESYTNFTLLVCDNAKGDLVQSDETADYYWEAKPDFEAGSMFPGVSLLAAAYEQGKPFFIEKVFRT